MSTNRSDMAGRFNMWAMGTMIAIQGAINGWTVMQMNRYNDKIVEVNQSIVEVNNRVIAIEASRFQAKDGLAIWREIAMIRAEMP